MELRVGISLEGKALVRTCLVLSGTVESMWAPAAPSPTDTCLAVPPAPTGSGDPRVTVLCWVACSSCPPDAQ